MANHFNSISNSETVLMGQGNEGGNFGRKEGRPERDGEVLDRERELPTEVY